MDRRTARLAMLVSLGLVVLAPAVSAVGPDDELRDEITVKGDTLRGRLVRFSREGVEFRTAYGDGSITVPYEDVERLETQGEYHLVMRNDDEVTGRVLGVDTEKALVGEDADSAVPIELAEIRGMALEQRFQESFLARMRAKFPHWKADFELGFAFEEGAVDKNKVNSRIRLDRRLAPSRFVIDVDYAYEFQRRREEDGQITKQEMFSSVRYDHDLLDSLFALGLIGVEFDTPRKLNIRTFPVVGLGYRIFQREGDYVNALAGFGWVYEEFIDNPDNNYAAALVGLEADWGLPRDMRIRALAAIMPGLTDVADNWLFRWEAELTVPVWDPLALRFRMRNINDSNPTPDTGNNKFETIMSFVFQF